MLAALETLESIQNRTILPAKDWDERPREATSTPLQLSTPQRAPAQAEMPANRMTILTIFLAISGVLLFIALAGATGWRRYSRRKAS